MGLEAALRIARTRAIQCYNGSDFHKMLPLPELLRCRISVLQTGRICVVHATGAATAIRVLRGHGAGQLTIAPRAIPHPQNTC